jgi:hypothetical protein
LLCTNCGLALQGGDEAAFFLCTNCGLVFEPGPDGLAQSHPLTAAVTSELAVAGPVQYLAVWRVAVSISTRVVSAWERIRKVAAPEQAYVYVPSFTLRRPVVQRLGVRLTQAQPVLRLVRSLGEDPSHRPALIEVPHDLAAARTHGVITAPEFGTFSPVILSGRDSHVLAHFVYLAVESHESRDLHSVDYELEPLSEELLFIPAVWDPRYIHESNWRLLLREFDGLVA